MTLLWRKWRIDKTSGFYGNLSGFRHKGKFVKFVERAKWLAAFDWSRRSGNSETLQFAIWARNRWIGTDWFPLNASYRLIFLKSKKPLKILKNSQKSSILFNSSNSDLALLGFLSFFLFVNVKANQYLLRSMAIIYKYAYLLHQNWIGAVAKFAKQTFCSKWAIQVRLHY